MTLDGNSILTLTGTVWVTGNLFLKSNTAIQLDPSYNPYSGIIVVDGQVSLDSNVTFCGSEGYKSAGKCNLPAAGNYLMILSVKNSTGQEDPAIISTSNTKTAVLYASNGFITLNSQSNLKEATGVGIKMNSNANVSYETGLANAKFSSGPGGGWILKSWEEIE